MDTKNSSINGLSIISLNLIYPPNGYIIILSIFHDNNIAINKCPNSWIITIIYKYIKLLNKPVKKQ